MELQNKIDIFINSLPYDRIFARSILKELADDKIKMTKIMKFVPDWVENVGKGETDGYQHFLLFPQVIKRVLLLNCKKSGLCEKGLNK